MQIINSVRQNDTNFGASEQKTKHLVHKWARKKRPDKLVLMLTRDDFPCAITRDWLDLKTTITDKKNSKTKFFREYSKTVEAHPNGIGVRILKTKANIVRQELFDTAINAIKQLMQKGVAAAEHQKSATLHYQTHSTELEYNISRRIPELDNIFSAQLAK